MFDEKPGLYLAVADPGEGPAPIFLDQNEARRAEKIFWVPGLPPTSHLSQSLGDRAPPHLPHLKVLYPPLSSIPLAEVGKDKQ